MPASKITIVCRSCGGSNVMRDAWAEWDDTKQEWVLGTVFDAGHCDDCGGEASLDEKPLEWRIEPYSDTSGQGYACRVCRGAADTAADVWGYYTPAEMERGIHLAALKRTQKSAAAVQPRQNDGTHDHGATCARRVAPAAECDCGIADLPEGAPEESTADYTATKDFDDLDKAFL